MSVLVKVNLPNRPEGDIIVITGLGEFPNGEVTLVRDDVLTAYRATGYATPISETTWPAGVEALELSQDDLQTLFSALTKRSEKKVAKTEEGK